MTTKKSPNQDIEIMKKVFYILFNTPIASWIPSSSWQKVEIVESYDKIRTFHLGTSLG